MVVGGLVVIVTTSCIIILIGVVICRKRMKKSTNFSTNEEIKIQERETEFINDNSYSYATEPTFCTLNSNLAYSAHTSSSHYDAGSDKKTEFSISTNCAYGMTGRGNCTSSSDEVIEENVYDPVQVGV